MAWRNIWRHKRRTILTSLSIGFGVWLILISSGIGNYTYMQMIDNSSSIGFGHVTILPPQYLDKPSLKKTVSVQPNTLAIIQSLPEVERVNTRIMGSVIASTAGKSHPAQFTAITSSQEDLHKNVLVKSIVSGEMFGDNEKYKSLIGSKLAEKLNLDIGKKFVITATNKSGEMTSVLLRVGGIFKTGAPEIDTYTVLIPKTAIASALGYSPSEATMVSILLMDNRQSEMVSDKVKTLISNNEEGRVYPWFESQPDLAGFIKVDRGSSQVFLIFVVFLAAAGILNTMLTATLERRREFGIMLALGMRPASLISMVVVESICLSSLGLLVGFLVTVPFHLLLVSVGWDLSWLMEDAASAGGAVFDTTIRSRIFIKDIIIATISIIGLSILSSLYPAIKSGRSSPIESIRALT